MKKDDGTGRALTGAQVRMARAALGWTISDAAGKAGIGTTTIKAIEAADGPADAIGDGLDQTRAYRSEARREALDRLQSALEAAGVTFAAKPGAVGAFLKTG